MKKNPKKWTWNKGANRLRASKGNESAARVGSLGGATFVRPARLGMRGRTRGGLLVGRSTDVGRTVGNPATDFAYSLRRRLKPIQVAPCVVTGRDGRPIAEIRTDPVTGKRTRVPVT